MTEDRKQIRQKGSFWSFLFTWLILAFYFLYIFFRIDPKLIYQFQQPVFIFDVNFMREFLQYPGGINALLSAFLSQFYYYTWTGALLLALLFGLVTWCTKRIFCLTGLSNPLRFLYWIPSILLLVLHSNYGHPLTMTLGILFSSLSITLYIRFAPKNQLARLALFSILYVLLYYIIAGQAFVFAAAVILLEVVHHRRIILALIYLFFTAIIPYLGASFLFIIHMKDAYSLHLTSESMTKFTWAPGLLYGFFPLIIFFKPISRLYLKIMQNKSENRWFALNSNPSLPMRLFRHILMIAIALILILSAFEKNHKTVIQVSYYARTEAWEDIVKIAGRGFSNHNLVQFHTNRALYHTGRLCDEMFSFPQRFGVKGLFLEDNLRKIYPLQYSDVFMDLGLVNEAEHYAYEALSVTGDTPWNLQRLVIINLIKKNREVTEKCLRILHNNLWHKAWADAHQKALMDNYDFFKIPQFRNLKSYMPISDFLVSSAMPELSLEPLMENRKNKMAFEYYMASCLLEGEINQFMNHLNRIGDYHYPKMPRHFEEAILIYMQMAGRSDMDLSKYGISKETVLRFVDFNRILKKYKNEKDKAFLELKNAHKNTYWFYALYTYHPREF